MVRVTITDKTVNIPIGWRTVVSYNGEVVAVCELENQQKVLDFIIKELKLYKIGDAEEIIKSIRILQ